MVDDGDNIQSKTLRCRVSQGLTPVTFLQHRSYRLCCSAGDAFILEAFMTTSIDIRPSSNVDSRVCRKAGHPLQGWKESHPCRRKDTHSI